MEEQRREAHTEEVLCTIINCTNPPRGNRPIGNGVLAFSEEALAAAAGAAAAAAPQGTNKEIATRAPPISGPSAANLRLDRLRQIMTYRVLHCLMQLVNAPEDAKGKVMIR